MKTICYILSGIDTALAFEWINEQLDQTKFKLHFILLHSRTGGFEEYIKARNIPHLRINYASKTDLPLAILKTVKYLKTNKIDVVHSHLLDAGLVGIIAAWLVGIQTRIYSRHYSTYHHVYYPKGVWYDKLINRLSTQIVAISDVVKQVLVEKEKVLPNKITLIYHGFPLDKFWEIDNSKVGNLKSKYGLVGKKPIIGVIARHTQWKGIQYIVPAFQNLLREYPESHLVLANAKGEYHAHINSLLNKLPAQSFTEIEFEQDLFSLYHCFNIFVHTPIDYHSEAFGQVYVEAMAAGIPSVFTLSGIGNELVKENENAIVAKYCDSESIYTSIKQLLGNPEALWSYLFGIEKVCF